MKRIAIALICLFSSWPTAAAEENLSIRGNFPQMLARGETTAQMANRIAVLLINLDRLIAPPCGMKRVFEFSGADHLNMNDLTERVDPAKPGVWRFVILGRGCWTARVHNVFVFSRGTQPAQLRLGVPGRTIAGIKYQQEATQLVLREANGFVMRGNCEDPAFLVDSAVTKARRPGQPWTETWSASACEYVRKFMVIFTPEGSKMRISVVLIQ